VSDETPAPLDPELTAYGALTEGMDPAAIQDPEIRSILTDRSKDLADIMRGESAEQVIDGRRYVHVYDPNAEQVGWISWEDYDERPGAYLRADQSAAVG